MIFTITEKSGFHCKDSDIRIYHAKKPYYLFRNDKKNHHFNLPAGTYETDNVVIIAPFRKYKLPSLPYSERLYSPEKFKVVIGVNPNKCTIIYDKKLIVIDLSLTKLPTFCIQFILLHEQGHFKYETESKADLYATYQALRSGLNPSQIKIASQLSLSDNNLERKNLTKKITKYVV